MEQSQNQQQLPAATEFDEQAASLQNQLIEYQHQQQDAAEKMQALQTYISKYGARIDIHHKSKYSPQVEQPNLGTAVPSWYYLDGRGNKVFVQDMNFNNALALARGGRGMTAAQSQACQQSDTVVVVPRAKRNPAWHAEYLRRCEEYEAARRRLRQTSQYDQNGRKTEVSPANAGRVAIPEGHRLIGDGLPQGHQAAFDATGRKTGKGSLWDVRQSQSKILGSSSSSSARSPQKQLTMSGSASNSMMVPYQQPQFLGSSHNSGVISAVMVDGQQQQQQTYFDPSATNDANNTAALQEEAARLLAQLSGGAR